MPAAGHSLVADARHIRAVARIRVAAAAGGDLGSPGAAEFVGVVAQVGRESGCGWDRSSDRIGLVEERCSLAAGTGREVGLGMGSIEGSVTAYVDMRRVAKVFLHVPEAGMGYATRHIGREAAVHNPALGEGSPGCSLAAVPDARHRSHSLAGRDPAGRDRRRSSRRLTC
jgi:hypothetical protein